MTVSVVGFKMHSLDYDDYVGYFSTLLKVLNVIGARVLPLGNHMKVINDTSLSIIKSRREQVGQSHNGDKVCILSI